MTTPAEVDALADALVPKYVVTVTPTTREKAADKLREYAALLRAREAGVTDAVIERAAEAIWNARDHKIMQKAGYPIAWAEQPTSIKRDYRKEARAALAVLPIPSDAQALQKAFKAGCAWMITDPNGMHESPNDAAERYAASTLQSKDAQALERVRALHCDAVMNGRNVIGVDELERALGEPK